MPARPSCRRRRVRRFRPAVEGAFPLRILIVSDAWAPQVNGVVRTIQTVSKELGKLDHDVTVIGPDRFRTIPCPTYPEIRLALDAWWKLPPMLDAARAEAIHIATEGPLGMVARRYCLKRRLPFTTAYHTRFPEYVHARCRLPLAISYGVVRRFHASAERTMVATESLSRDLKARGFDHLVRWTRGVDIDLFKPGEKSFLEGPRPISLYCGRVAIEKNIQAFLKLDLPGTKYVVGDGPQLEQLRAEYPDVRFVGAKFGEDLARHYAAADVFVFPSLTDTFGLVLLEALASGVPVAAYPVTGPRDVLNGAPVGVLDKDLGAAVKQALRVDPDQCRDHALKFSWRQSAEQFLGNLAPLHAEAAGSLN